MKIKTYYELPQGVRTFIGVMLCLLNILVVFMACLTSARSVQGYTLAVTGFVLLLMTYAHEKERRKFLAWPLIAYAFYSILVCIHSFIMHMRYRDVYQAMVAKNGMLPYADSYVPLILGGMVLEVLKEMRQIHLRPLDSLGWGDLAVGAVVAAVVGYFSLALLVKALKGKWFWLFGPYCLVAGLLTLLLT